VTDPATASGTPAAHDDLEAFAASVARKVGRVGGAFMISRSAAAHAKRTGLRGWDAYVAGRGAVLDRVDADVVAAAFVFFPRDLVRECWGRARASVTPEEALASYREACLEHGRAHFADLPGASRLAVPLFAGWRAVDRPDDDAGRVALAAQCLREHRGGLHGVAVLAEGLTPLQAILSDRGGADTARFFGWPEPYPDVSDLGARRVAVERLTDRLVAPAYAVLAPSERAEFADLVTSARAALG
jgi:Helix-turn-helix family